MAYYPVHRGARRAPGPACSRATRATLSGTSVEEERRRRYGALRKTQTSSTAQVASLTVGQLAIIPDRLLRSGNLRAQNQALSRQGLWRNGSNERVPPSTSHLSEPLQVR